MKTLSPDEALANATWRHSLTRPGPSIEALTADLVGLHNTTQTSPYLSVRARLPDFARTDLETLMWPSWRLARIRAMRLTMFIFPHDLIEIAAAATRHLREALAARWLRDSGLSAPEFERMADAIEEALSDGPLTSRALRQRLRVPGSIDLPGIVSRMCDLGRLVGGRPPRQWRSGVRQYHCWADVLPDVDLNRWDEDAAIAELVRRYIASYGPVTIDDMAWWTGLTKGRCRLALEQLGSKVEPVGVAEWPGPLYRIGEGPPQTTPDHDVKALPLLDPYVQGYRNRARLVAPDRHEFVWDRGGNAAATVVRRGRIIGVWQVVTDPEPAVRFYLFDPEPNSVREATVSELAATGALYFDEEVAVAQVDAMEPLGAGGGRSAAHPLDAQLHRASRRSGDS